MKVLFLGSETSKDLPQWLRSIGDDVTFETGRITPDHVKTLAPDFIVIFNYPYILSKEVIDTVGGNAVNLHISYLPWNRGAYPNIWSYLDNTPKGVSIIRVDEGIDTGDIIARKELALDDTETLRTSHAKLHNEIQDLFRKNWPDMKSGRIRAKKQQGQGSIHYAREFENIIKPLIKEKGWDTPVKELKIKYAALLKKSQDSKT